MVMAEPVTSAEENISFTEYLKLEEQEHFRHEYLDELVVTKHGESFVHHDICQNLARSLKDGLNKDVYHCFLFSVKTEATKNRYYFYPDVVLTCSKADLADEYVIRNPLLIAEVFSPSTESYTRNEKWNAYRRIPSLMYFLLVSQTESLVEVYSRSVSTALFQVQDFSSMDDVIHFQDLNFPLSLQQIYQRIRFENPI
jgi:Uma2 family endonuclease